MKSDGQYDGFRSSVNVLLFSMIYLAMLMEMEELCVLHCINSCPLHLEKKRCSVKLCLPKAYSDQVSIIGVSSLLD